MRPQAHIAAGLLVWGLDPDAPVREAPLQALAGNLPDLDRTVAKRLGVTRRDHHRWVSHSFVGWAPPSALALALTRGTRAERATRRFVANVWIHLLLDSYADGVAWAWPLHKDKIGLFRKPPEIHDDGWRTPAPLHTNMGRAETAFWIGLIVSCARKRSSSPPVRPSRGRASSTRPRAR